MILLVGKVGCRQNKGFNKVKTTRVTLVVFTFAINFVYGGNRNKTKLLKVFYSIDNISKVWYNIHNSNLNFFYEKFFVLIIWQDYNNI